MRLDYLHKIKWYYALNHFFMKSKRLNLRRVEATLRHQCPERDQV